MSGENKTGVKLTEEQKAEYLMHGGTRCPYCKSTEVDADSPECDGTVGWANVCCETCRSEWTDQWSLTGIAEVN
jgi:transposase-like protein